MIVYDKNTFASNRDIDANGYLRVEECNISKCQLRPYLGKEIPNWREFGLEPNKIYNVYCPKEELEKAVPTFNNLPLTREHIEVDVDNVPKEKIVGSLGDHASFEYPYLKNNLIIYDKKDIDLVMSGKKKELSCGYRYTPVQQSGEVDGQHYDFVMTDIIGNHVALVKQGRAGRDVMVADSSKGILDTIKEKIMAVFDKDLVEDEFKESEHPREKNGQFTSKGGSGSGESEQSIGKSELLKENKKGYAEAQKMWNENRDWKTEEQKRNADQARKMMDFYAKAIEKLENNSGSEKSEKMEKLKEERPDLYRQLDGRSIEGIENVYQSKMRAYKKAVRVGDNAGARAFKAAMEYIERYVDEIEGNTEDTVIGDAKQSEAEQEKVGVVMKEFKEGELKSGSGEKVTDPKQAIAIALSEAEKVKDEDIPEKQDEPEKAGDDKALIKGEEEMTEEVKEALAEEKVDEAKKEEVVDDACGKAKDKEVKACDKSVDKRALIDEIGGILKDKLSEEEWRTVIKKAEELAYNDSEASADDEKKEELKGKEKEAFAEGVDFGEKKEKEEPKKLDSEHEAEGAKKADEKKEEMAKDEAMVMDADAIRAEAREEVLADFKARETARKAVRKVVGDVDVFAFDSAEEIYKFACEKSGMDLTEVASYKDAFRGLTAAKGKLALDASPISGSNVECLKDIRIAY